MEAKTRNRLVAYSSAAAVGGALLWAGVVQQAEADLGMLLSSAETQLGVAAAVPVADEDGRRVRDDILDRAEPFLRRAEAVAPKSANVLVARGDFEFLRGNRDLALAQYGRALEAEDCSLDGAALLRTRRAEILLDNGDLDGVAREVESLRELGSSQFEIRASRLEARMHELAGRPELAIAIAERLANSDDIDATLAGAEMLEMHGRTEAAERAYRRDSVPPFLADYCVARLKLRGGEFDTALDLLKSALGDARLDVMALLRRDQKVWRACTDEARFRELLNGRGN